MYFEMDCPCKGKNLDKMLQPGILMSLYHHSRHGYEIIRELSQNPMFQGLQPDKTGVYRYLKKMEQSGYLISDWQTQPENDTPRKVYTITEKGKKCLLNWKITLRIYAGSIENMVQQITQTIR